MNDRTPAALPQGGFAALPRPVLVLGLTSLLTDTSSEMIYPLLPLFVTTVLGAGPAFLGLVEGAAETTASLLKLASGALSDRMPRRKPLVVAGYALASFARPLVALAAAPWHVLAVRVTDRIGKGLRTSPRDALLADATPSADRGRVFGFHRAMDHAGSVAGPLLAMLLLWLLGEGGRSLRIVFAVAAVPAIASVVLLVTKFVEPPRAARQPAGPTSVRAAPGANFHRYLAVVFLFTLGNSADAFLLLRAMDAGISTLQLPLLWVGLHLVKSAFATPGGVLADRLGRKRTLVAGWLVYAVAYALFGVVQTPVGICAAFAVYGFFFALSEGAEKALVADLVSPTARGTAFGRFHAAIGVGALPASALFGFVWQRWGSQTAFTLGAGVALAASLLLWILVREPSAAAA